MAVTVSLREVRDSDLDFIFDLQRDPASVEMAAVPSRDRETFDAHWVKIRADPETFLRIVVDDEVPVGNAMSFVRDGYREVGYWIDRSHWGRGIASDALRLLVEELPRPLSGVVAAHNAASRRVLEKHGFVLQERMTGDDGVLALRFVLD